GDDDGAARAREHGGLPSSASPVQAHPGARARGRPAGDDARVDGAGAGARADAGRGVRVVRGDHPNPGRPARARGRADPRRQVTLGGKGGCWTPIFRPTRWRSRATSAPNSAPATTSLGQWTPTQTRLSAMSVATGKTSRPAAGQMSVRATATANEFAAC